MRSPANHQAPSNYRLPREKDPTVARNFARLIEYSILYSIPRTLIEFWHLPSRNSLLWTFSHVDTWQCFRRRFLMRYDEPRRICGIRTNEDDCVPNGCQHCVTNLSLFSALKKACTSHSPNLRPAQNFQLSSSLSTSVENDSENITLLTLRCTVCSLRRCNTCE